jgi:hypothetical protein
MYEARLGLYTTSDPMRFSSGDFALYQYADNRPLVHSDPLGLWVHGFGLGSSGAMYLGASGSLLFVADNIDNYRINDNDRLN